MTQDLKASEIKKVLKSNVKEFCQKNNFIFQKDCLLKIENDIVLGTYFRVLTGRFTAKMFVRPLYYEPLNDYILNLQLEIESENPDDEGIIGYNLSKIEEAERDIKKALNFIEKHGFKWFDLLNTAEKIVDYLDDKTRRSYPCCTGEGNLNIMKAFSQMKIKKYYESLESITKYIEDYLLWIDNLKKHKISIEDIHKNKIEFAYTIKKLIEDKNYDKIDIIIQEIIIQVRKNMKLDK